MQGFSDEASFVQDSENAGKFDNWQK